MKLWYPKAHCSPPRGKSASAASALSKGLTLPFIADVIGELRQSQLEMRLKIAAMESTMRHLESMILELRRLSYEMARVDALKVSRETEKPDGNA